jgi:hypothetical protein
MLDISTSTTLKLCIGRSIKVMREEEPASKKDYLITSFENWIHGRAGASIVSKQSQA